ncbi:PepSY domain-containing protein [Streptomyces sp. NPDC048507]|uniref:PepSY domain-containing protein n=1 Tax=Streptomyces sp. NPDC048507 TaxID=3365560 RepID=UPI00372291C7
MTALCAGALTLALTACGQDSDRGVDTDRADSAPVAASAPSTVSSSRSAESPSPSTAGVPVERGGPKVPRTQAMATAERSVAGGRVTDVRLENDNGNQVWKIDVMTGDPRVHNVKVDAATGALLGDRADRMPDRAREYLRIPLAKLDAATVDREAAAASALRKAGTGFVSRLSIQGTESRPLWRLRVTDGATHHRVEVDAKSGEVTRHVDRDSDDDRPDRTASADTDRGDEKSGRPSAEEIRERSGNFGRDHYDWSRHVPR